MKVILFCIILLNLFSVNLVKASSSNKNYIKMLLIDNAKKSNYVKRCVGVPGDTLEIIDGLVFTNGSKNVLPERAKVQYIHYAYSQKGVSSRKLGVEGYSDYTRLYKIENITEQSYKQILPHIIGRKGNTREDFKVITESKGLPSNVIYKPGLKVSEILELKKEITLTLGEAETLRKLPGIDSVVRRINKINVPFTFKNLKFIKSE